MRARIAGKFVRHRGVPREGDVIYTGVHVCTGRRRLSRLHLRNPANESSHRLHLYAGDREHDRRGDHLLRLPARVRGDRTPSRRPTPSFVQHGRTASEEGIDRHLRHRAVRRRSDDRGAAYAEHAAEDRLSHDDHRPVCHCHGGLLHVNGDNAAEESEGRLQADGNYTGIKSARAGKFEGSRKCQLEPDAKHQRQCRFRARNAGGAVTRQQDDGKASEELQRCFGFVHNYCRVCCLLDAAVVALRRRACIGRSKAGLYAQLRRESDHLRCHEPHV